jgi:pimeloyl-ACP methyl ester carboxylesterase
MSTYLKAPNKSVTAPNGIEYAYRETGEGGLPLVMLMHFRGNLDNWDPALVDALAAARRVVTFDNAGVGGSSGTTPRTVGQMAHDAIAFMDALDIVEADLLGFSVGSFVAQEIALICPARVRRLVLASSAPQGAAGMHGSAAFAHQQAGRRAGARSPGQPDRGPGPADHLGPGRRSTTRCARGECPTTRCSRE